LFKFLIIIFITLLHFQIIAQDQDTSQVIKQPVADLTIGLKKMLSMLKQGEKEKARIWFNKNYYELHSYNLLTDSILINLAKEDEINPLLTESVDTHAVKDSLVDIKSHHFIVKELQSIAIELGESPETILPEGFIKDVEKYVVLFSENPKYHSFFQQAINKSRKYIPLFRSHFIEKGFPKELLYFIIIESGFDENAISKVGAAGMFQFMPATARQYGLTVSKEIDERFSAFKSAKASSTYLKDLYLELGSINLALTSYNTGSGRTRSALKELTNLKERGFWAIREKSTKLAKETREYVPQIFAAIVIAKNGNPAKFNFMEPEFPGEDEYSYFILPAEINIKDLTDYLEISNETFFRLNPDLKEESLTTPKNVADYPIFVPRGSKEKCLDYLIKKLGNKKFDGTDKSNQVKTAITKRKNPKSKNKK